MQEKIVSDSAPRDLRTIRQFTQRHTAFTEPGIRNLVLNAEERLNSRGESIPGNGLAEAGAIVRVGRRVLIDEQAFFRWIARLNQRPAGRSADRARARKTEAREAA